MSPHHEPTKSSLSWRELWPFALPLPFAIAMLSPALLLLLTALLIVTVLGRILLIPVVGPRQLTISYASLQISFPTNFLRIALPFLLFVVVYGVQRERLARQAESNAHERTFIDRSFISVRNKSGSIIMVPGKYGLRGKWGRRSHQPVTLAVGSSFEVSDCHWHRKYKVTGIDDDGVLISYQMNGFRRNRGELRIHWK